jgi:hypothetical protein
MKCILRSEGLQLLAEIHSGECALQGFGSNATLMNCNVENLVAIDGCITTILKMVVIHGFNTTVFKMLQSSVAIGGRYCNDIKWLQ